MRFCASSRSVTNSSKQGGLPAGAAGAENCADAFDIAAMAMAMAGNRLRRSVMSSPSGSGVRPSVALSMRKIRREGGDPYPFGRGSRSADALAHLDRLGLRGPELFRQ